jgi:hypothetical protein
VLRTKKDHERSRREIAIKMMMHFDKNLDQKSSMARKLLEQLDQAQIQKIYNQEEVEINSEHENLILGVLQGEQILSKTDDEKFVKLNRRQSSNIRWATVKYINLLETVLAAWHYGIADQEIITTEFKYIYDPKRDEKAIDTFRKIAGGKENFPAVHNFICALSNKSNEPEKGKDKII